MGADKTDKIAFLSICGLAVLVGAVLYVVFGDVTPKPNVVDSIYRDNLPQSVTNPNAPSSSSSSSSSGGSGGATSTSGSSSSSSSSQPVDESKYTNKVTINILEGAQTQGNPSYGPDPANAPSNALITWVNQDTVPHTATSGADANDPQSGKLFDSSIIVPNGKYSVPAEKLGKGEHPFYCSVHPFMHGKVVVS
jgi:plastocyanin